MGESPPCLPGCSLPTDHRGWCYEVESLETSSDFESLRLTQKEERAFALRLVALSRMTEDQSLEAMLELHLDSIIALMPAVTSAITKVVPEPSMPRPMLSPLLLKLDHVQRMLHSTVLYLRAMTAQSSSSMPGSSELYSATHTETLGDSSSSDQPG